MNIYTSKKQTIIYIYIYIYIEKVHLSEINLLKIYLFKKQKYYFNIINNFILTYIYKLNLYIYIYIRSVLQKYIFTRYIIDNTTLKKHFFSIYLPQRLFKDIKLTIYICIENVFLSLSLYIYIYIYMYLTCVY